MGRPFFGESYEEFILLLDEYNNYLQKRAVGETIDFWPDIIKKYFALVPAATEKEREDKIEKIKAWFQNHANRGEVKEDIVYIPNKNPNSEPKTKKIAKSKSSKRTLEKTVTQVLRGEKKTHIRSNFNVYASLYETEAAVVIDEGWREHKAIRVAGDENLVGKTDKELDRLLNGERVNVRNNSLKLHYATLPESIKKRCEAKRLEKKEEPAAADSDEEEERQRRIQRKNRITAVRNLNEVVEDFLKTNCNETGFSFFLIAAGPDPRYDDEITSFSCEYMAERTGKSFVESFEDYEKVIKIPFKKVVKNNARNCNDIIENKGSTKLEKEDAKDKKSEMTKSVKGTKDDRTYHQSKKIGQSSLDKGKSVIRKGIRQIQIISDEETDYTYTAITSHDERRRRKSASSADENVSAGEAESPLVIETRSQSEEENSSSDSDTGKVKRGRKGSYHYVKQAPVNKVRNEHAAKSRGEPPIAAREKARTKILVSKHRGTMEGSSRADRSQMRAYIDSGSESENEKSPANSEADVVHVRKDSIQNIRHGPKTQVGREHGEKKRDEQPTVARENAQKKVLATETRGIKQGAVRATLSQADKHVVQQTLQQKEKAKLVQVTKQHGTSLMNSVKVSEPKGNTRQEAHTLSRDVGASRSSNGAEMVHVESGSTENTEDSDVDSDFNRNESDLRFKKGAPNIVCNTLEDIIEEVELGRKNKGAQRPHDANNSDRHINVTDKTTTKNKKETLKGSKQKKLDKIGETDANQYNGLEGESSNSEAGSTEEIEDRVKVHKRTSALRIRGDNEYETEKDRVGRNSDASARSLSSLTSIDDSMSVSTAFSDIEKEDIYSLYDKNMILGHGYIRKGTVYLRRALADRSLVILDHWHTFERKKGFIKYDGIIAGFEHMPAELKAFFINPDYGLITLPESDIEYGKVWTFWWRIIQPHWRLVNSNSIADMKDQNDIPDYENWETLCIGGKKGILIAIVGVAIWAETWKARKGQRKTGKEIDAAVKDVNLVLEMMTMFLENSGKGKKRLIDSNEQSTAGPSKRQKVLNNKRS